MTQLTKSLAIAYAPLGIRVNANAPGFIVTEQTVRARADEPHYHRVVERTPLGPPGEIRRTWPGRPCSWPRRPRRS